MDKVKSRKQGIRGVLFCFRSFTAFIDLQKTLEDAFIPTVIYLTCILQPVLEAPAYSMLNLSYYYYYPPQLKWNRSIS